MSGVSKARLALIAMASFLMYFCSLGLMSRGFNIIFFALRDMFEGSISETIRVQSIYNTMTMAAGPVAGVLLRKFGGRVVGLIGSLCLTVGLITSAFAPSLQVVYVTFGVIGGFGGSLLHITAAVIVLEHFDMRRSLMFGICRSALDCGNYLMPFLIATFIDEYRYKGTFLLLSGFPMQCIVAAALIVPPPKPYAFLMNDASVDELQLTTNDGARDEQQCTTNDFSSVQQEDTYQRYSSDGLICQTIQKWCSFFNLGYVLFSLSWAVIMIEYSVPFVDLTDFELFRGISIKNIWILVSIMGFSSIFGKVVSGFLGDIKRLETTLVHILPVICFGTSTLIRTFMPGYTSLAILSAFINMMAAIFDGVHPVIIMQLVGREQFSLGLGMFYFFCYLGPRINKMTGLSGWLYDEFGKKEASVGLLYLSATLAAGVPIWKYYQKKKTKHNLFK